MDREIKGTQQEAGAQAGKPLALEMFGFTREELQDRVVDQLCNQVMRGVFLDEDGDEVERDSSFAGKLRDKIKKRIDESVQAFGEKHVLPNVTEYIEKLTLAETNKWGEKKGGTLTFVEYLVQRAEAYMIENVNHEGKGKGEDSYGWSGNQSRITYLIHKHLQYSISTAMEGAMKSVNQQITEGIAETVKIQLAQIVAKLKPQAPKI